MSRVRESALQAGLVGCHTCLKVSAASQHQCDRCGSHLHARKKRSIEHTIAFGIAGILAFIPANLLPIMVVTQLGVEENSTIIGGVATFWSMHAYPVAIIIFIASVMIPGLKFIAIAILVAAAKGYLKIDPQQANRIYWLTELVGRWSMVDVFVVAILVGLIQMGNLMTIRPGGAAVAFGLMVILTMLSAHSFDPRLIWDRLRIPKQP
ncbi:MAG: paraquat-inducible protein A [Akkermansiaceae bacterium]|nr:paraquat-inducible protein A [Akkermansiaceae bacterium]MCF7731935.1 paraquat-inducible protein A [Akkermansiaceae bacterium]